ncbi:MAG: hypothetical protein M3069_04140, partial [Chloroflexota bacterium]|nr:hypothetical protein [Chloroflexota bacterium]
CQDGEWRWQAGRRRFHDILLALRSEASGNQMRHPHSDVWREQRGLDLRGNSYAEQLESLRGHALAQYAHQRELLRGSDLTPGFQRAADELVPTGEAALRLEEALTEMLDAPRARWLLDRIG